MHRAGMVRSVNGTIIGSRLIRSSAEWSNPDMAKSGGSTATRRPTAVPP